MIKMSNITKILNIFIFCLIVLTVMHYSAKANDSTESSNHYKNPYKYKAPDKSMVQALLMERHGGAKEILAAVRRIDFSKGGGYDVVINKFPKKQLKEIDEITLYVIANQIKRWGWKVYTVKLDLRSTPQKPVFQVLVLKPYNDKRHCVYLSTDCINKKLAFKADFFYIENELSDESFIEMYKLHNDAKLFEAKLKKFYPEVFKSK